MDHRSYAGVLVLMLVLLVAEGLGRPQAAGAGKQAPVGTAYDEIVVETHLAVRPKSPSVGVGLRRAKAVYFRPNATASGAEVRRIAPLANSPTTASPATSSSTTGSDGIAFAARVVGVENPLAIARRARIAAAAERSRRELAGTPGSYSSSSSSYSFKSSSSSKSSHQGPVELAKPVAVAPASAGPESSSSSNTSHRSASWTLPSGQTYSVHEDSFSSQEHGSPPSSSTVLRVIVGDH